MNFLLIAIGLILVSICLLVSCILSNMKNESYRMETQYTSSQLDNIAQLKKQIQQLKQERDNKQEVVRLADVAYDKAQDEFENAEYEMRSGRIYRQTPRYVKASKALDEATAFSKLKRKELEATEQKLKTKEIQLSEIQDVTF